MIKKCLNFSWLKQTHCSGAKFGVGFSSSRNSYSCAACPESPIATCHLKQKLLNQEVLMLKCGLGKPHSLQVGTLKTGPRNPPSCDSAVPPPSQGPAPRPHPPHTVPKLEEHPFSRPPASSLSRLETILHTAAGRIFLKPFLSCHFSACCFLLPFVKSRFLLSGSQGLLQNVRSSRLQTSMECLPPGAALV